MGRLPHGSSNCSHWIRYSGPSLPYHIGNCWSGGSLPATVFAIVAATGNIYPGLWYPIAIACNELCDRADFLPETKDRGITRSDVIRTLRSGAASRPPAFYLARAPPRRELSRHIPARPRPCRRGPARPRTQPNKPVRGAGPHPLTEPCSAPPAKPPPARGEGAVTRAAAACGFVKLNPVLAAHNRSLPLPRLRGRISDIVLATHARPSLTDYFQTARHCEERSDESRRPHRTLGRLQFPHRPPGLLRCRSQ